MQLKEKGALSDARDPRLRDDPRPAYKKLRDAEPVHRTPCGRWIVPGHGEVASSVGDTTVPAGRHRHTRPAHEDAVRRPQVDIRGLGELRVDPVS